LPLWQRVGKIIQGEPQVADASAFYNQLQERLNQNQPLAADALAKLGAQRAEAILAALMEAGVDPARAAAATPEKVESDIGKPVPLKLGLVSK
jgi:predicted negative regulator of RcsB-dependent stress response